ncbi:8372_t:CDS:1 [Cetraspora pellucida]|uniref:8372_t:CDS:1 n=1 Tax=Cetraspora pellucida TaxID=1433469 RepID=A0A9N9AIU0_9GLOM|nr:8372_t:CDS:1 [Cetraspora pellucida]
MRKSEEIQETQLSMDTSSEMGILKSCYENSFDNELFSSPLPPYQLTLEIDELISPPKNSRKAKKFLKNPHTSSPPRPQNAFVLFRRDFYAKLRIEGIKMKNGDISRLASEEWHKQPKEVLRYFEILEQLAKDKHNEMYPDYKYSPQKNNGKKSKSKIARQKIMNFEQSPESYNEMSDVTSEELEKNLETPIIENINVSDPTFSESTNLDFLLYSEYEIINNFEQEYEMINNFDQLEIDQTFEQIDQTFEPEIDQTFELEIDQTFELEIDQPFELEIDQPFELEIDQTFVQELYKTFDQEIDHTSYQEIFDTYLFISES